PPPNGSQRSTKRYSFFIAYTPSSNRAEKPTMQLSQNNRKATDFFTQGAGIPSRHVSKKSLSIMPFNRQLYQHEQL
ncbi:hypothetical protein, partial [Prevotella sp. CAG:255]|uniref:hypothetical protein n=1 Tax=Prevotella sp. CAG:255 TaxID=1262923 RepID=UPI00258C56EF